MVYKPVRLCASFGRVLVYCTTYTGFALHDVSIELGLLQRQCMCLELRLKSVVRLYTLLLILPAYQPPLVLDGGRRLDPDAAIGQPRMAYR